MKHRNLVKKVTRDIDIRDSLYQLITMNPFSIQSIKGNYLDDDMWKYAIDLEPSVFQYIDTYKKVPSAKLCMYAIMADGKNIQYIHPSRITDYMIEIAQRTYPNAELLIQHDEDYEESTPVKEKSSYVESMESKMMDTIISEIRQNPRIIREISNPTDEMIAVALITNPDTALYFDTLKPFMVDILEEYYPDIAPMYPNYVSFVREHSEY